MTRALAMILAGMMFAEMMFAEMMFAEINPAAWSLVAAPALRLSEGSSLGSLRIGLLPGPSQERDPVCR